MVLIRMKQETQHIQPSKKCLKSAYNWKSSVFH